MSLCKNSREAQGLCVECGKRPVLKLPTISTYGGSIALKKCYECCMYGTEESRRLWRKFRR